MIRWRLPNLGGYRQAASHPCRDNLLPRADTRTSKRVLVSSPGHPLPCCADPAYGLFDRAAWITLALVRGLSSFAGSADNSWPEIVAFPDSLLNRYTIFLIIVNKSRC
jgi:hypothetical protein